jgi:NAD(P)-dependent dehydrogenase (short-subunit alcohol dehydrogenase family)
VGRIEGKVALITGAAGGIGAAAARRLAGERARLLLTDADEQCARALANELGDGAHALAHDVTSEEQWQSVLAHALDTHGRIDMLLNNAGVFLAAPLTKTTLEQFRRVQDVNVTGVFLGMRTVAPARTDAGADREADQGHPAAPHRHAGGGRARDRVPGERRERIRDGLGAGHRRGCHGLRGQRQRRSERRE